MRIPTPVTLLALAVPIALLGACSKETPKPTGEGHAESHAEAKEAFGRLTPDEVEARIAEAKAGKLALLVVDNNNKDRFQQSHLPGARWLQFNAIKEADLPANKDTTLVFYCSNEL